MTTSTTQKKQKNSTDKNISEADFEYYSRKLQRSYLRIILEAFSKRIDEEKMTRAELASLIKKSPAQVTRWLSVPSNMTAETISRILCGLNAKLEPRLVFIDDLVPTNSAHELFDAIKNIDTKAHALRSNDLSSVQTGTPLQPDLPGSTVSLIELTG